jgi:O-antigen biosynthesis protein
MPRFTSLARKGGELARVMKRDGAAALAGRALQSGADRLLTGARPFDVGVRRVDLVVGDGRHAADAALPFPTGDRPLVVNIINHPPDDSGGIMTLSRIIHMLERRGHDCRMYVMYMGERHDIERDRRTVRQRFPHLGVEVHDVDDGMRPADIVLATAWPTAYCARAARSPGVRFYLVQDFEPMFYPASSNATLAEETYRFGFHGLTAGRWLSGKLSREYAMACDSFDLGVDLDCYRLENPGPRNAVMFYARPSTERRGYELGMLALELFARRHPDVEIHLVGQEIRWRRPTFAYTSHGHLPAAGLAELYNQCAAGLVLSLTNISLLPAELLAAGCLPVMNDAENTRASFDHPYAAFSPARPDLLADALSTAVTRSNAPGWREQAAASVGPLSWELVADQVEAGINRGLALAHAAAPRTGVANSNGHR